MATDYKYFFAEYQIKREFSKPVRTFVLSGKDKSIVTEFENNLRKTYRDLAKMFSPDVISDPETLEVCEPIIRSIHAAHEVLDTNLKK